jgi:hypothetical protein
VTDQHFSAAADDPPAEEEPDVEPSAPVAVPPPLADPPGSWAVTVHPGWLDEHDAPTPPPSLADAAGAIAAMAATALLAMSVERISLLAMRGGMSHQLPY